MNGLLTPALASPLTTSLVASDHWHDHDGRWFPWFPLVPLFFVTLWLVVIFTLRRRWHHSGWRSGEAVLAERFARGEIDEHEYLERRSTLRRR